MSSECKFIECNPKNTFTALYDFLDSLFNGWSQSSGLDGSAGGAQVAGAYGSLKLSTGGTDAGGWGRTQESGSGLEWIKKADGKYMAGFRFGKINALNDGSDQYTVVIGVVSLADPISTITDGIYFRYDNADASFIAVTESGDAKTETDTGVDVAADTFYFGRIEIKEDGSEAKFYLGTTHDNMVLKATHTDNIPTAFLGPYCAIEKSLGTTERYWYLDFWGHKFILTTPR